MSGRRQKNRPEQEVLAFPAESRSDAPRAAEQGTETLMAKRKSESRRLRSVVWKQWKRGRTRFRELRKRNVSQDLAAQTAGSPHGPWRIANSPALAIALPNVYFAQLGLPPMVVRS